MADPLHLKGKLDLSAVGRLHADLLARADHDVTLDLGEVTQMGSLCLQTCIAAARSARSAGHDFQLINVPDHVLGQLRAMGVTPESLAKGLT